jgi:hypothetical protein
MGMAASQGRLLGLTARMSDVEFSSQQKCQQKVSLARSTEAITTVYTEALNKMKFVGLTGFNKSTAEYADISYAMLTGVNSPLAGEYCLTDSSNKVVVPREMKDKFDGKSLKEFLVANGVTNYTPPTDGIPASPGTPAVPAAPAVGTATAESTYYTNLYKRMSEGYTVMADESKTINNKDWINSQLKNGGLFLEKFNNGKFEDQGLSECPEIHEVRDTKDLDIIEAKYNSDLLAIQTKDKKLDMDIKQLDTEHSAMQTEMDSDKKDIEKNI